MPDWIKEHWIRFLEIFLSLIFIICGWRFYEDIVHERNNFNLFGYIASIATLYALIIAILEVAQNLYRSKSLIQEVRDIQKDNRDYAIGVFSRENISIIEDIDDYLVMDEYLSAKACLKSLSRNFYQIPGKISDIEENRLRIDRIHEFITDYCRAVNYDKIPQQQKKNILNDLRNLKRELNTHIRSNNEKAM